MENIICTFSIEELINKLDLHDNACKSRANKAAERIMQGIAKQNDDILPNKDSLGRLHAPYEGYEVDGVHYNKGQFIPVEQMYGDDSIYSGTSRRFEFEAKRLINGDILEALNKVDKDKIKGVDYSFGKQFERSGSNHAYIYIKAISLGSLNVFTSYIEEVMTKIREVQKSNKGIAPEGRVEIEGTVINLPIKNNPYAYNSHICKVTIELKNGSTVYGTLPNSISSTNIGDKVRLVATCEQAKDDKTHAFFSRPVKAVIISE